MSVVAAPEGSFEALEKLARQRHAKGCFIERGSAHRHEKKIARWLSGVEEEDLPFGEFAAAQVQVAPLREDCDDADCQDASCANGDDCDIKGAELAGPDEIRQACGRLVADLPASFRADVRSDAEAIAGMCVRLCPEVPWLTLRLEVTHFDACWRWHQDAYVSRTLVTYVGPGTCAADDTSVRWDEFAKTAHDETNDSCVSEDGIIQMQTNAVLLMKGNAWPGIRGEGLTHKAPGENEQDEDEPTKRLLLKVDLHNKRPPLGDEPFSDEEDEEEDEKEDDEKEGGESDDRVPSGTLKRSATSEGDKSHDDESSGTSKTRRKR